MSPLHELRTLISRHAGTTKGEAGTANIPRLLISAADAPTKPLHHVFEPVFVLVAQGAKQVMLGDKVFSYGVGEYLVVSVDLPISSRVEMASADVPCLSVGLTLRPAAIATLLLDLAEQAPGASDPDLPGLGVSQASFEVVDAILRLLRLIERPGDAKVLAPLLEKELLWRLLSGPQSGMVRQIGLADSRLSRLGRTIRWIRTNYAATLRIDDLSRAAGMSASTFHRHFRATTTMTPVQYQKQIRLQEARLRILSQQGDVANIGFSVGYNSPSQFNREYTRFYGISPGRDAVCLRELATRTPRRRSRSDQ